MRARGELDAVIAAATARVAGHPEFADLPVELHRDVATVAVLCQERDERWCEWSANTPGVPFRLVRALDDDVAKARRRLSDAGVELERRGPRPVGPRAATRSYAAEDEAQRALEAPLIAASLRALSGW